MAEGRAVLRASRPLPALTGTEDVSLVAENRLFNHGYRHFLVNSKIRELFGDRIANSKRVRKARIREILKNIMHTIDRADTAVVNDFIAAVEAELRKHIAEVQSMASSAATARASSGTVPVPVPAPAAAAGRRRRRSPSDGEAKAKAAEAAAPGPGLPMEVVVERQPVNPLQNQLDFLAQMLQATGPGRPTNMTARQVERDFKRAKTADENAIRQEEARRQREENARRAAERKHIRQVVRDDLADLFAQTGVE